MLRGDQSLPEESTCSRLCCPLRAMPVNLGFSSGPLDQRGTGRRNSRNTWSEIGERIGVGSKNQPTTPWGSYVRADLSIVSSSNLPVEGQIDVTNFSVALFASQITRLSYAETSLFSLGSGRIRCFISPDSRRDAAKICRWHASGNSFRDPSNDNRLTPVGYG